MEKKYECPHCDGTGEEPGAPIDLDYGTPNCSICGGYGAVDEETLTNYWE